MSRTKNSGPRIDIGIHLHVLWVDGRIQHNPSTTTLAYPIIHPDTPVVRGTHEFTVWHDVHKHRLCVARKAIDNLPKRSPNM